MFHVLPLWVGAFVAPLPPLPARTGPRAALRCHASADGPSEPPELEPDLSAWRNVRHQLSRTWEGDDAGGDEGWAHTVPSPEPGCVLLAKPNVRFVNDPAKMLSVVLVLQRGQSVVRACASSGRARRLWAARLSQEEAGPLGVHTTASGA